MKLRVYRDGRRWEWFEVKGRSPEACRAKADVVCRAWGWESSTDCYSEQVEQKGIVKWITQLMKLS